MENKKINILTDKYALLDTLIDWPADKITELDLGCGKGSFSTQLALRYPERFILSADIMIGRCRKLFKRNEREGIENSEVLRVEARHLIGCMMKDNSLDRLHVLCPDPWPKDRHSHNRLICSNIVTHIHRILKPGGVFHFATDDEPYWEIATNLFAKANIFTVDNSRLDDIKDIKTDFEKRWNEQGKEVHHIAYIKAK